MLVRTGNSSALGTRWGFDGIDFLSGRTPFCIWFGR